MCQPQQAAPQVELVADAKTRVEHHQPTLVRHQRPVERKARGESAQLTLKLLSHRSRTSCQGPECPGSELKSKGHGRFTLTSRGDDDKLYLKCIFDVGFQPHEGTTPHFAVECQTPKTVKTPPGPRLPLPREDTPPFDVDGVGRFHVHDDVLLFTDIWAQCHTDECHAFGARGCNHFVRFTPIETALHVQGQEVIERKKLKTCFIFRHPSWNRFWTRNTGGVP